MSQKPIKRILTIDGGGLRGIFSAAVIEQMELKAGRPAFEIFDCIVGTSAGSMLAAGLACGKSASELRSSFEDLGNHVFGNQGSGHDDTKKEDRSKRLEETLKKIFGDRRTEAAKTHLVIPARDMALGKTLFFGILGGSAYDSSFEPDPDVKSDAFLWELVLRSTALPPIFAPSGDFLDGGVSSFANPSYGAYVGVWKWFDWDAREYDLQFHSVGTGYHPGHVVGLKELPDDKLYGLMVMSFIQDVSFLQHMIMKKRRSDGLIRYKRYNVAYTEEGFAKLDLSPPEEGFAELSSTRSPPLKTLANIGTQVGQKRVDASDFAPI